MFRPGGLLLVAVALLLVAPAGAYSVKLDISDIKAIDRIEEGVFDLTPEWYCFVKIRYASPDTKNVLTDLAPFAKISGCSLTTWKIPSDSTAIGYEIYLCDEDKGGSDDVADVGGGPYRKGGGADDTGVPCGYSKYPNAVADSSWVAKIFADGAATSTGYTSKMVYTGETDGSTGTDENDASIAVTMTVYTPSPLKIPFIITSVSSPTPTPTFKAIEQIFIPLSTPKPNESPKPVEKEMLKVAVLVAPSPPPTCGNGVVDHPDELCDGADLRGADCVLLGAIGGNLSCTANCRWNPMSCVLPSPTCGNGVVDHPYEHCDGSDLRGMTCTLLGASGGDLVCNPNCTYNGTACFALSMSPAASPALTAAPIAATVSETQSVLTIHAFRPATLNFPKTIVKQVTVETKALQAAVSITVSQLAERPASVQPPPLAVAAKIYRYLSVEPKNIYADDVTKATLQFTVERSWLTESGVAEGQVALARHDDASKEWQVFAAKMTADEGNVLTYEAAAPRLSTFAIVAQPAAAAPSPTQATATAAPTASPTAPVTPVPAASPTPKQSPGFEIIAALSALGVAVFVLRRRT